MNGDCQPAGAAPSTEQVTVLTSPVVENVNVGVVSLLGAGPATETVGAPGGFAPTAAWAFTRPAPPTFAPKPTIGVAVATWVAFTWVAVSAGFASICSAPTAAACGVDAEVPKNRLPPPKNVLMPPSVADTSGFCEHLGEPSGAATALPTTGPNRWVTGPRAEKFSTVAELLNGTAPSVCAASVPLWPKIVGPKVSVLFELLYSVALKPANALSLLTHLIRGVPEPDVRRITSW